MASGFGFYRDHLQKLKRHDHSRIGIGRQIAGTCGLLLYLAAFSPVGMATLALLGTLDSDHQIVFKPSLDGLSLVLHHQAKCVTHQHHAIARALTIFSQPASPTDPDHVVSFGGGESLLCDSPTIVSASKSLECAQFVPTESVLKLAVETKPSLPLPNPPDGPIGNLRGVRTTILLI